jgi:hypothetical protein
MLEVKRYRDEDKVTYLHVQICKYRNIGKSLWKKIEVELRWHDGILSEFKLMILSRFYIYSYIGFIKLIHFLRIMPTHVGKPVERDGWIITTSHMAMGSKVDCVSK